MVSSVKLQVKHEVEVQTRGLATNRRVAQLETTLVRELNNKLLIYGMGTATILSLIVVAQHLIKP